MKSKDRAFNFLGGALALLLFNCGFILLFMGAIYLVVGSLTLLFMHPWLLIPGVAGVSYWVVKRRRQSG